MIKFQKIRKREKIKLNLHFKPKIIIYEQKKVKRQTKAFAGGWPTWWRSRLSIVKKKIKYKINK
jgi:hypothetical protein